MSSIRSQFTRENAGHGVKEFLPGPDGKKSTDWLVIRGTDSDIFREARNFKSRDNLRILALPKEQQEAAQEAATDLLLSSLVASWSFEEECTTENILELFREAPAIKAIVDSVAVQRERFMTARFEVFGTTP